MPGPWGRPTRDEMEIEFWNMFRKSPLFKFLPVMTVVTHAMVQLLMNIGLLLSLTVELIKPVVGTRVFLVIYTVVRLYQALISVHQQFFNPSGAPASSAWRPKPGEEKSILPVGESIPKAS